MSNFVRHSHFCFCIKLCVKLTQLFSHEKLDQIGCSADESWHTSCPFDCLFTIFAWYVDAGVQNEILWCQSYLGCLKPWALQSWTSPLCVKFSTSGRRTNSTQRQLPCFLELAWLKLDRQNLMGCPSMKHTEGDLVGWLFRKLAACICLSTLRGSYVQCFHCWHYLDSCSYQQLALKLCGSATLVWHAFPQQVHHVLIACWQLPSIQAWYAGLPYVHFCHNRR